MLVTATLAVINSNAHCPDVSYLPEKPQILTLSGLVFTILVLVLRMLELLPIVWLEAKFVLLGFG